MITLDHVTKRFRDGTVAVDNLTLDVPSGEITVLLGPSGCGKTTTLRMVNRLTEPTTGTISLNGRDLSSVPTHVLRRGMGYVIQQGGLFPHRTVVENIATVPKLLGWDTRRQAARSRELLELVGLDQAVADRYPSELSGGQQQRVGVARALAADPPVLLMDEPFGAVDPVRRTALQRQFRRLQQDLGKTVILVTHDVDEAVALGDQIAVMRPGGVLAQHASTPELLTHPTDAFVAAFVGSNRGHRLLALRPASQVPTVSTLEGDMGRWKLETDTHGRPCRWEPTDNPGAAVPVAAEVVGPDGTIKDLLDSALASPTRTAVRVDGHGALEGFVPWTSLERHLGVPTHHSDTNGEMGRWTGAAVQT